MNRGGLLYRRLASPLHAARPGVAIAWVSALIAATLLLTHPLTLLALTAAVVAAGAGAGLGARLLRTLRSSAIIWVPIVLVNVLVSRDGLTVFARLGDLGPFGQGDLTVEAAVYGAVIALKVALLLVVTTLASLAIDPDGVLRIVRRVSYRSAVTASLATRLVPVLSADAHRLAEAQRTRPTVQTGTRARIGVIRAVVTSALDRSLDVAATLELRGFATAPRAPRERHPWSRHDVAFLASAAAVLALALLGGPAGVARFAPYPQVHGAPVGPALGSLCVALVVAVLLPFCDRRGVSP